MKLLLKLFYRLLYHEFAWMYDWVSGIVSFGRWKEWVFTSTEFLGDSATLELGFGPGHLQFHLAENSFPAYGMDLSWQMARIAHRRIQKAGMSPNLVQADNLSIPFAKQSFEQIVSTFPTEAIFEDQTITEIIRVLKPGGKLFIIPMVFITGNRFGQKLMAWLYHITGQSVSLDQFDFRFFGQFFDQHGLKTNQRLVARNDYTLLIVEVQTAESD